MGSASQLESLGERERLLERLSSVQNSIISRTDVDEVADAFHQALHDPLTGLPNRLLLRDRLEQALARATRTGRGVAVLFLDLDAFKNVNDSLGHTAGDELLEEAADRLLGCVRATDTVARFGGDEFVAVLEVGDEPGVAQVANRILSALERPFKLQARETLISASVGIAIATGDDDVDDLLRNADLALHRAKEDGKGRKRVFEPEMHAEITERLELEASLAGALQDDELALHYQPILDLRSGELAGIEALVRWRHSERGLLMPADFVPLAEEARLMGPLGRWVLESACDQAARWRREHPGLTGLALSVNVSSVQLGDSSLVDDVRSALVDSGLPPERLVLELTETAFLGEDDAIPEQLERLKELGLRLAVDDFGTGNASLRYLTGFPIDLLKIHRSFVEEIVTDHRQSAIARSVIDLCRNLGMNVVGVGIETSAQAQHLLELGCELGQGFHLASPIDPTELGPLVDRGWDSSGRLKPRRSLTHAVPI